MLKLEIYFVDFKKVFIFASTIKTFIIMKNKNNSRVCLCDSNQISKPILLFSTPSYLVLHDVLHLVYKCDVLELFKKSDINGLILQYGFSIKHELKIELVMRESFLTYDVYRIS